MQDKAKHQSEQMERHAAELRRLEDEKQQQAELLRQQQLAQEQLLLKQKQQRRDADTLIIRFDETDEQISVAHQLLLSYIYSLLRHDQSVSRRLPPSSFHVHAGALHINIIFLFHVSS